jgi:hypothetical protein
VPLLFADEGISCTDTTVLGEREVLCALACELERCRGAYIICLDLETNGSYARS